MTNSQFKWPPGYLATVSLTYDDALPAHHESVAPALEVLGLRATFYVPLAGQFLDQSEAWRGVAQAGHELGNHSIFHPCRKKPAATWPESDFDLKNYSIGRLEKELTVANQVLRLIDGQSSRTYGNTCHNTTVGEREHEESMEPLIGRLFVAGRGARTEEIIAPVTANLSSLGCFGADHTTFEELKKQIDSAVERGGWIIYCAHDVSKKNGLAWDQDEHQKTIEYLASKREIIWTAPVREIAQHIASLRTEAA